MSSPRWTCRCTALSRHPDQFTRSTARPRTRSASARVSAPSTSTSSTTPTRRSAVPDGKIDPSGTHIINLPSPLTSRDNLRQAEADLDHVREVGRDAGPRWRRRRYRRDAHQPRRPVARCDGRHREHRVHRGPAHGGALGAGWRDHASCSRIAGVRPEHHRRRGRAGPGLQLVPVQPVLPRLPGGHRFGRPDQPHQGRTEPRIRCVVFKVVGDGVVPNSATDRLIIGRWPDEVQLRHATRSRPAAGAYVTFTQGSHGTLFDPTASLAATHRNAERGRPVHGDVGGPGGPFLTITDTTRHRAVTRRSAPQRATRAPGREVWVPFSPWPPRPFLIRYNRRLPPVGFAPAHGTVQVPLEEAAGRRHRLRSGRARGNGAYEPERSANRAVSRNLTQRRRPSRGQPVGTSATDPAESVRPGSSRGCAPSSIAAIPGSPTTSRTCCPAARSTTTCSMNSRRA